ncbi:MAG: glycosyl transferase [Variovorax sp.]|nr:MAG: glycosyl transferase [Variovorax sp.]
MKKTLRLVAFMLLALVLTAAVAVLLIVKLVLAPEKGEWSTRAQLGPVSFDVGVPTAVRLLTSHWFAPQLDGRVVDTRFGTVRMRWLAQTNALELDCAPCSVDVPALGSQPVRVERLVGTVRRDASQLSGTLVATPPASAAPGNAGASVANSGLRGRWDGRLSSTALQLNIDMQDGPLAQWYAVLVPGLPELQRARIGGTMALRGQFALPARSFSLQPQIAHFTVAGLGTEALLDARSSCGASARLANDSWLARAVLAAEDQRFFTHAGYDLTELTASIDHNQQSGRAERGGSTLSQQLAKLLVTGDARTAERKLRELLYAVEMEQTLGKARILQHYLDNAPWGANLCGAEAASRHYFQRSAARLEPAQAVWLAAMLRNPQAAVAQWQRDGAIDTARATWVAEGIRGIPRRQREALLKSVAAAKFAPP